MTKRTPILALILSLLAGPLSSQESREGKFSDLFLERSYISHMTDFDLLFEAQIAPHLFIRQTLNDQLSEVFIEERRTVRAWSISFTPLIRLRMFDGPSSPVRTPSFMPKFDGQYFWLRRMEEGNDESGEWNEALAARSPIRIHGLQATLGHHSNGQEGCLFAEEEGLDGDCRLPPGVERATINRDDGSFSTNYLRLMAYRMDWHSKDGRLKRSQTLGLGVEIHPEGFGPGGVSQDQLDLYGDLRLLTSFERVWRTEKTKRIIDLQTAYIAGKRDLEGGVCDCFVSLEGSWSWDELGGWGVFARYVHGQDYYNLSFVEELSKIQVGIVFDTGRFSELQIPAL